MSAEPDECGTVAIGGAADCESADCESADCESASTVTIRINNELALPHARAKDARAFFVVDSETIGLNAK